MLKLTIQYRYIDITRYIEHISILTHHYFEVIWLASTCYYYFHFALHKMNMKLSGFPCISLLDLKSRHVDFVMGFDDI